MSGLITVGQQAADGRATSDETVVALRQAMGVMSSVCDYAQQLDARGFSAADAWLGHVLAQMPRGLWSDSVALAAWDMLRKYRGQLAAAAISYDELPRPAGADELEAGRREEAREQARGFARAWREQQYRQARSYVRCDGEGEQVTLAFPYDPDLVAGCRKIDGRRYDGAAKANVFPFTSLPAVIELAAAHGIEVTADVRVLAAIAAGRAAERAAQPQVRLDEPDGTIIIDASLDPALYEKVRELGGRWDSAARVHRVPGHHAPELADLAGQHGLRVGDQVREFAASTSGRHEGNRAAAGAFEADPVPVPGLAGGVALKPQQYPVVRFALEHRRVLIGDDMGWGKTASSLAAVAADGAYPAVVVCRPSLTLNWAAETARFFPGLTVAEAAGTRPRPIPAGTDVIIIGSAALAGRPRRTPGGGREFGWVAELKKIQPKALIIDEGQDTKERGANRSQACEQLAAAIIARDGLVLDLTGTAILNRPRELCQQLTILGRIAEFGGPKKFLWRYCLAETSAWGASYDGARNLIELHDRLRAWGIMIRRSDDAALGLPPCREHVLPIPLADLDAAVMTRYRQAEADLLGFLAEQARQAAQKLGEDPESAAVAAAMRASAAEHLVAINTLRQLAGQAKRGYVTHWVRQHVAAGEKVMIAAHHRDEVDAYAAAFGGLKLQGGQPVTEKEAVKARFQSQPPSQAPAIAVAIGAGGVGHTLTAARIGIQAEQAWTPGETQQMKKRLHRIGQDRPVDYYITVAEDTIDEHLWAVVTAKQATLDAVLDGRSDTGTAADGKSVAAELTWRLTRQGLATRADDDPASGTLTGLSPGSAPPDQQDTAPSAEWSWKWSGDLIKVYVGSGIAGRVYRDQGPRGTFYRAETASDPHRSLASDREVARHLTGIDAAVAALCADRDRGHREPADENSPDGDDAPGHAAGSPIPDRPLPPHAAAVPAALPGTCIVPGCGQRGRRYPAGTLCDTHRPGPEPPPPQVCPECGLAVPAHATACAQRPASLWPATEVSYGQRDAITDRQWQEAHLDPDKVRAWCRDTGRGEPPVSGALPPGLINDYLAGRGATDIPMPGGPDRGQWLARRPVLTGPFTARLGPLTVTYGPCPRCGHPTAADPGDPLPLCANCASQRGGHDSTTSPAAGPGELTRDAAPGNGAGQPAEPAPAAPGYTGEVPAQTTGQPLQGAASRPVSRSGPPSVISSALDEATLAAMRADAEATAGPFTDPALLRKAELALGGIDDAWLQRVVGHPAGSWRSLGHAEMLLAVRAAEADAEHLAALAESDRRKLAMQRQATAAAAQAIADAAAAQWQQLRDQLPVPVTVQHNWTARHLDGYEQGADHIIVLKDLHAGRLHRAAGTPLCQTPSRARQLTHVSPHTGDERRLPDCAACLSHAEQLAATRQTSSTAQPGTGRHAATPTAASPQDPPPPAPAGSVTRGPGPGPGGASRPGTSATSASGDDDETSAQAWITGQQLREAAHRYLEDGLLPVPAWAARQDGGCCCPRGAGCGRPGKHPRSVHAGPGPGDYSWRPLTCRTHAEIDQRFADDSPYAAGNLMVAIPEQMMAIDVDDDDGGRAAAAGLAGELGDLPPTLAHCTPHGEHLIYRTPPGWKGRAWVGKDPANPLPAGIDLRMPGQILMAAPSVVPGQDGPARYGPVTGDHMAALPAPYVTAWTPPQPQPRPAGRRVPVPPDSAGRAARYVHEAMTRIADDLASHQPGGRNAAAYAAGLKAGSLLGAARSTPGAEHAAWTDQQAEEALMDAAERNGYTGKDGQAEARRAIRSGLCNGLSAPRALPDFTTGPVPGQRRPPGEPAPSGQAPPQPGPAVTASGRRGDRWQDRVPADVRRQIEDADRSASDRRGAAITAHQQALDQHSQAATAATAAEVERTRAAARATHEAYTRDGRHVTGRHDAAMLRWAAEITAQDEQASQHARQPAPASEDTARMQAYRAAVAANEAYKAGDLDRARDLTEQAAALDPSRATLWQQHRNDIAARGLIIAARAAHAEGDHERAGQLMQDARELDPRLRTLWDGRLPAQQAARSARPAPGRDTTVPGHDGTAITGRPTATAQPGQQAQQRAWPSEPARPGRSSRPAPAASQPAGTQLAAERSAEAASPREPRATAPASTEDPEADAGDDTARWPSPNPRSQAMSATRLADRETGTGLQAPAESLNQAAPGDGPSADWRDHVISQARRPWQPGPSWPDNPAIHRIPEAAAPEPGIEPGR